MMSKYSKGCLPAILRHKSKPLTLILKEVGVGTRSLDIFSEPMDDRESLEDAGPFADSGKNPSKASLSTHATFLKQWFFENPRPEWM